MHGCWHPWSALDKGPVLTRACSNGLGFCLSLRHGVVIGTTLDKLVLQVHSLWDGALLREFGAGRGRGPKQFWWTLGGVCLCPDGASVLVANSLNNRLQEIRFLHDSDDEAAWGRVIPVRKPEFVDCDAHVIVVSSDLMAITLLSWQTGAVIRHLGLGDRVDKMHVYSVRLIRGGTCVIAADTRLHRLRVFNVKTGLCVSTIAAQERGVLCPSDMIMTDETTGTVVVANWGRHALAEVAANGVVLAYRNKSIRTPSTVLAPLPDGGFAVREYATNKYELYFGYHARLPWVLLMAVCVRP